MDQDCAFYVGTRLFKSLFLKGLISDRLLIKFRPDIVVFQGLPADLLKLGIERNKLDRFKMLAVIHIVEVGYVSDTRV
jgi:hypothetical protein